MKTDEKEKIPVTKVLDDMYDPSKAPESEGKT